MLYEPNRITLSSNENGIVTVYLEIPNTFPDRLLNEQLTFTSLDNELYITNKRGIVGLIVVVE